MRLPGGTLYWSLGGALYWQRCIRSMHSFVNNQDKATLKCARSFCKSQISSPTIEEENGTNCRPEDCQEG